MRGGTFNGAYRQLDYAAVETEEDDSVSAGKKDGMASSTSFSYHDQTHHAFQSKMTPRSPSCRPSPTVVLVTLAAVQSVEAVVGLVVGSFALATEHFVTRVVWQISMVTMSAWLLFSLLLVGAVFDSRWRRVFPWHLVACALVATSSVLLLFTIGWPSTSSWKWHYMHPMVVLVTLVVVVVVEWPMYTAHKYRHELAYRQIGGDEFYE